MCILLSVETMGYKCIAPGCNSGYDSNPGSFHFFLVPKDPAIIALWQRAILRDDIVLRYKHPVCEKHFYPEDIVWMSEVRGPDGTVISKVNKVLNNYTYRINI